MKSPGDDWPEFLKRLKCLMRDSLRLDQIRTEKQPETFVARRARLEVRLSKLIDAPLRDCECRRLVKRLRRHASELFTFLDNDGVTADNNYVERRSRPAMVMRKKQLRQRQRRLSIVAIDSDERVPGTETAGRELDRRDREGIENLADHVRYTDPKIDFNCRWLNECEI